MSTGGCRSRRGRAAVLAAVLLVTVTAGCGEQGAGGTGARRSTDGVPSFPGAPLVLVSVDTLRADRLGCYGYERGTSPRLDAFAREAVLFEDVYANSPKTASSHMSLFTSLPPSVHKVSNYSARLGLELTVLPQNRMTLAQTLNRSGYWNVAVAGGGNMMAEMGFARGFQGRFESGLADLSDLVARALHRLDQAPAEQPPFLFLHTYQVHGPYLPPREFMERFAPDPHPVLGPRVLHYRDLPFHEQWKSMNRDRGGGGVPPYWEGKEEFGADEAAYLSDLYDGEVAYTDQQLGLLFDALRERGLYDRAIVVVLSDHGEEFHEHGDFEHDQLHREHLHVPLLVRLPGGELGGTRVRGLASLLDVMPTLLDLLDLEGPATMTGVSLVPAMVSGRNEGRPVLSERVMFPADYKASLRSDGSTVIFHATQGDPDVPGWIAAYDLRTDPGEQHDVYAAAPFARRAAQALREQLTAIFHQRDVLDSFDSGERVSLTDPELVRELQQLGYTDPGTSLEVPPGTPLEHWPTDT